MNDLIKNIIMSTKSYKDACENKVDDFFNFNPHVLCIDGKVYDCYDEEDEIEEVAQLANVTPEYVKQLINEDREIYITEYCNDITHIDFDSKSFACWFETYSGDKDYVEFDEDEISDISNKILNMTAVLSEIKEQIYA